MINFNCPFCNDPITVDPRYAGQTGRCRRCGNPITVPSAQLGSVTPTILPPAVSIQPAGPAPQPVFLHQTIQQTPKDSRSDLSRGFNITCGVLLALFVTGILLMLSPIMCAGFLAGVGSVQQTEDPPGVSLAPEFENIRPTNTPSPSAPRAITINIEALKSSTTPDGLRATFKFSNTGDRSLPYSTIVLVLYNTDDVEIARQPVVLDEIYTDSSITRELTFSGLRGSSVARWTAQISDKPEAESVTLTGF